jgi:hypothetical protein
MSRLLTLAGTIAVCGFSLGKLLIDLHAGSFGYAYLWWFLLAFTFSAAWISDQLEEV